MESELQSITAETFWGAQGTRKHIVGTRSVIYITCAVLYSKLNIYTYNNKKRTIVKSYKSILEYKYP